MKQLTFEEYKAVEIGILLDVANFCEKHSLTCFLAYGTLIGAVRHKGFIPWDDDVDLLMTREEFEKFRVVYPKECDQRFELTYLDTWTPRVMNRDPEKAAAFTARCFSASGKRSLLFSSTTSPLVSARLAMV